VADPNENANACAPPDSSEAKVNYDLDFQSESIQSPLNKVSAKVCIEKKNNWLLPYVHK